MRLVRDGKTVMSDTPSEEAICSNSVGALRVTS
jgi:hypothetical protein